MTTRTDAALALGASAFYHRKPLAIAAAVTLALAFAGTALVRMTEERVWAQAAALAPLQAGYATPDQLGAMLAGQDQDVEPNGQAVLDGSSAAPTPGATSSTPPSMHRCEDVPPSVMPAAVRAYCAEIDAAADRWGMDPRAMALVVIQECPWADAACTSPMGAQGLSQIMPGTAPEIARATGLPCTAGKNGVALDPATNLVCGAWYYAQRLIDAAPAWHAGDEAAHVAIAGAGYNGGPGRGAIALAAWRAGGHPCEAPGLPTESRDYCHAFYDRWQLLTASPAAPSVELGIAWRPRP